MTALVLINNDSSNVKTYELTPSKQIKKSCFHKGKKISTDTVSQQYADSDIKMWLNWHNYRVKFNY